MITSSFMGFSVPFLADTHRLVLNTPLKQKPATSETPNQYQSQNFGSLAQGRAGATAASDGDIEPSGYSTSIDSTTEFAGKGVSRGFKSASDQSHAGRRRLTGM